MPSEPVSNSQLLPKLSQSAHLGKSGCLFSGFELCASSCAVSESESDVDRQVERGLGVVRAARGPEAAGNHRLHLGTQTAHTAGRPKW